MLGRMTCLASTWHFPSSLAHIGSKVHEDGFAQLETAGRISPGCVAPAVFVHLGARAEIYDHRFYGSSWAQSVQNSVSLSSSYVFWNPSTQTMSWI